MKRSLILKFHVYAGLFTSFYLIIFGFSALKMNHNLKLEKNTITHVWQEQISINSVLSDKILANDIRDKLGIMGWVPYWKFKRDSMYFNFQIQHFGKNYYLKANTKTGMVEVSEAPKGFLEVIHGFHFFNGTIPNASLFLKSWKIYKWLSLFVMIISIILGIWLWLKYSYKPWQGMAFGILFIATILIMIFI